MAKRKTVDSELETLTALVAAEHAKFKAAVAAHIAATLATYDLTLAELTLADLTLDPPPKKTTGRKKATQAVPGAKKRKHAIGPRRVIPPKYRDPESGATWSGRARPPAWIKDRDRNQFLINGAA